MNYRHAYHAGNFADVMKHALMALVLEHLKKKEKPFFWLDTHAGTGLTDLAGIEAGKTGEAEEGITRLLAGRDRHPALAPYLDALTRLRATYGATTYPGSPLLARALMRPGDRLAACELHPDDGAALSRLFGRDRDTKVQIMNGYQAVRALLPPKERRGGIIIDPPFENRDEFEQLWLALEDARNRWPNGTLMLWYPVKDPSLSGALIERFATEGPDKTLLTELHVMGNEDASRFSGSGLIIVNPPYRLDEEAASLMGWLAGHLAQGPGARGRVEWIKP